jgi:hypothetical protein
VKENLDVLSMNLFGCHLQAENIYNDEESDVTTSELQGQGS